ncbi:hypothetical protein E3P99_02487 [Wallemia hederae]|uniref:Smr domain-containing protein n=1 Tax=Wallemia hederae TaxID=1540922 RepID=A0A4T0FK78_9BASI|nr:hypothetical protein E3P99_02487 [Wallemia hederae]
MTSIGDYKLLVDDYADAKDPSALVSCLDSLSLNNHIDDNVIDFLTTSFPSLSTAQLQQTLSNNKNDLDATIEYLISNESRLAASHQDAAQPTPTQRIKLVTPSKNQSKQSNKSKKAYSSFHPANRVRDLEPPPDLDWVYLESISSSIHRQLGVSNAQLVNSLRNLIETSHFQTLSASLSAYLSTFKHILDTQSLDLLLALFDNQNIDDAKLVLQACNNRIEDAEVVLQTLNQLKASELSLDESLNHLADVGAAKPSPQPHTAFSRARSTPSIPSQSISAPTGWSKVNKKPSKKNTQPLFPHLPQVTKDDMDANDFKSQSNQYEIYCRKMEDDFRIKRQTAIKDAGHLYQSSKAWKHGTGAIASQARSQQAREYKELADEWAIKAAKASIQSRSTLSENVIDLHYLTLAEALAVASDSVDKWWSKRPLNNNQLLKLGPLMFITGVGLHSTGKQPILFPQVSRMLESNGWNVERQASRGCIIVKGR